MLSVFYGMVKEYDIEVDPTDVDAVVDIQVNVESKALKLISLTRQVAYDGLMFNPESQVKMLGTKKLNFDATVLKDGDLQAINRCFPDLEDLVLEAQNAMVYKFDVRKFKNLKFLELIVCPSEDYPGLISKELPNTDGNQHYFDNFYSDDESQNEENEEEEQEAIVGDLPRQRNLFKCLALYIHLYVDDGVHVCRIDFDIVFLDHAIKNS